ncbi:hypothetical protein VTK73DRAFT_542 [Phialemonium thermophilum]|uniref:Uncharacterized protein n=1 Tax=Phialemonium thermophilum TaxID=223376 RepID=A0ABR3XEX6_9PEZI
MSATALVGQVPTNLGPLTTTFTPPAACTIAVGQSNGGLLGLGLLGSTLRDVARLGQACDAGGPADATTCWPPTTSGVKVPDGALGGWGFYSPGLDCPAGHASACSATGGAGGSSGWPVQFNLQDGETAIGCCPSGYTCTNINGQTCVTVATSTVVPMVTCDAGGAGPVVTETIPDNAASITAMTLLAPMIQLNFQSSDKSASSKASAAAPASTSATDSTLAASSSAAASSAGTSSQTSTSVEASTDSSESAGSSTSEQQVQTSSTGATTAAPTAEKSTGDGQKAGGLPKVAVMGIAIGAGSAALLIAGSSVIICARRRRKAREERELDQMYGLGKLDSRTGLSRADEFPGFSYRVQQRTGDDRFGGVSGNF